MRRSLLLVVVLVFAVAGEAPTGAAARAGCVRALAEPGLLLPAAVRVTTRCASSTISRIGRVAVSAPPRTPAAGVSSMAVAGVGAPVVQQLGRIAVLQEGRIVWRSHSRFRAAAVFALMGPEVIAFSSYSYGRARSSEALYLARFGGRERRLAVNEWPLGWTAGGRLLTWRYRQGLIGLFLRDRTGHVLRRVASGLREIRFDEATRTVLALTRQSVLERSHGQDWRRLATLSALRLDRRAMFDRLAGGLIGVLDGRRVTVLRADGSIFASARFRAGDVAGESGLVANPAGTQVAFAVTNRSTGRESVYLLRAGERAASRRYSGPVDFAVCERWATLAWHDSWLLYATTEGKTLLLTTRVHRGAVD